MPRRPRRQEMKNRQAEAMKKDLSKNPEVIRVTLKSIEAGIRDYVEGLVQEVKAISDESGLQWEAADLKKAVSCLFKVCLFHVPPSYREVLNDSALSDLYDKVFLSCQKENVEDFKNMGGIVEKFQPVSISIFCLVLALEFRPFFETILKSPRAIEISARSLSFVNDYVQGFCANNPVVEGFLGDLIAKSVAKSQ
jgi:hypothetical protein